MVSLQEVERQLKQINASFKFWGRAEMLELQHVLIPGEQIQVCINGRYEGGFAMLCSTDQRLLLIDKKPMYLTLEDIRYDMVAEVDYSHRLIDATIRVCTPNKTLVFTTWKQVELRKMTGYLQHRVIEIRQGHMFENQLQQQFVQQAQQQVQAQQVPVPIAAPVIAAQAPVAAQLPMPTFVNPYSRNPLIMRRRISRFHLPRTNS
jgi:hypothetical protein